MRSVLIDIIKVVAGIMIVGRHVGFHPMTGTAVAITEFCDYGVAVYGLVSGYLMRASFASVLPFNLMKYLKKRANRLVPLYFIWSLFYVVMRTVFDLLFDGGVVNSTFKTIDFWVEVMFAGEAAGHLWFLIVLFYCQIVVALLWCIGILKSRFAQVAVCCISILLINRVPGYWGYHLMRLMAFLLLGFTIRSIVELPNIQACRGDSILKFLGDATFGVYLIHPLFIIGVRRIAELLFVPPFSVLAVMSVWMTAYLLSLTAVSLFIRQRLPLIRRIVGM